MEKSKESVSIAQLNGLIKQRRNDEIKDVLLKDVALNLINKKKLTLIHTAVMFNNIDAIAFLFTFGFNINAQNTSGQTPLLLAAQNNSYQAVQLLLALDADIFIADNNGQNTLQVLLQKDKNTPAYLLGNLFERLKRSDLSRDKIVNELVKAECSIEQVLSLNDVEVTREMLIRTKVDKEEYSTLLRRAIYSNSSESAKILLEQEPGLTDEHQNLVIEIFINLISNPTAKATIGRVIDWDQIVRSCECMDQLLLLFSDQTEDVIQVFIDVGIDKYCRKYLEFEVLVELFYNKNVDPIEIIKNTEFDVNMLSYNGDTALGLAVSDNNKNQIVYLLNRGADTNIRDENNLTYLSYAKDIEVVKLLIDGGADFQIVFGNPIFSFSWDHEIHQYIIANLMIVKAQGLLQKDIRESIYEQDDEEGVALKSRCDSYSEDLDWMKTRWFSESFNLFSVLTEKPEYLTRYVKDKKTFAEILKAIKHERPLKPTYVEMLKKNLKKTRELKKLRFQAASFLGTRMYIAD